MELLRLPAAVYGAVVGLRGRLYDRGWLPATRLEVPVVSVGNLTAGGTGKTPLAHWLAVELSRRGRHPGLLSRGYRRSARGGGGENDESRLSAALLPGVPCVEAPDRIAGGRELVARGADVIVLDDGFQHRRLARDLDLVLVDATRPWGLPAPPGGGPSVRAFLPRGLLREPLSGLARADAVVLTRADQSSPEGLAFLEQELQEAAPGKPLVHAVHRPWRLRSLAGEEPPLAELRGRQVDLLSGIGNPDAFEETVRGLGADVRAHRRLADHHDYGGSELEGLGGAGRWILTTAKDAVKWSGQAELLVLDVRLELVRGAGPLEALLDALPRSPRARERASFHEGLHG